MTGPGSGADIVSAQTNALEGVQTGFVRPLSKALSMSQLGLGRVKTLRQTQFALV
jgi:hypothetical protein